jgi:signal transduction histidine kinase
MSEPVRRILVADDEDAILQAFRDALNPIGGKAAGLASLEEELFGGDAKAQVLLQSCELSCVSQGQDAIEAVRKSLDQGKPFGVVFLDMRMPPGIDGKETALAIRKLDPFVNIVIVTGYSDVDVGDIAAEVLPADKLFFIAKPFQVAEIRQQAAALSARWVAETAMVRELQEQVQDAYAAREEADRANAAKSLFITNVSHELRTPLNAIIGFSDMISQEIHGPLGDARYIDYSKEIHTSGSGLLGAINDLIDTARLDLGSINLHRENFDLVEVVGRVIGELAPAAKRKSVALLGPDKTESPKLYADRKRVYQVVFAILHNAIKFTPGGKKVAVSLAARGHDAVVTIADEGIGVPADLIAAVGRPFSYGDDIRVRSQGGMGLGLSLAKRLLELHQGRMTITAEKDVGSVVELIWPLAEAAERAA